MLTGVCDVFTDVQFSTEATYIRVPATTRPKLCEAGLPFREGLHAASHALLNVLPLYLMCNAEDVGTECDNPYDTRFRCAALLLIPVRMRAPMAP